MAGSALQLYVMFLLGNPSKQKFSEARTFLKEQTLVESFIGSTAIKLGKEDAAACFNKDFLSATAERFDTMGNALKNLSINQKANNDTSEKILKIIEEQERKTPRFSVVLAAGGVVSLCASAIYDHGGDVLSFLSGRKEDEVKAETKSAIIFPDPTQRKLSNVFPNYEAATDMRQALERGETVSPPWFKKDLGLCINPIRRSCALVWRNEDLLKQKPPVGRGFFIRFIKKTGGLFRRRFFCRGAFGGVVICLFAGFFRRAFG